jgi:hypothetical protein
VYSAKPIWFCLTIPPAYPHYLTLARCFTADEINRGNVVLIGGRKAMPWDYLFDGQLNFVTDYGYAASSAIVRNRNPKPGEQSIYKVPNIRCRPQPTAWPAMPSLPACRIPIAAGKQTYPNLH